MATHRFFYVTQDHLVVWMQRRGAFIEVARFRNSDEGFRRFSSHLREDSQTQSLVLVDVIEEEFSVDSIPKLPLNDRNALIDRRLSRKYSRTPYRLAHFQGTRGGGSDVQEALYSAVSNDELLNPWLEVVGEHATPLVGIFSVPLLGARLLSKIRKPAGNALLLSQHQGNKLRQTYLRDGKLKSARLSQAPDIASAEYGEYVFDEILRSRRYLERTRLLGVTEDIDVYMITDSETADRIISSDKGKMPLHFHFIAPEAVTKTLKLQHVPETAHLETVYFSIAARGRNGHNYAVQGETRFHRLSQVRRVLISTALAASLACSLIAGSNLMVGFEFRGSTALLERQIRQMEETFRRENDRFAPLRADSHEMKMAVDTGDYILANRLPVSWVMRQLGQVFGEYPQIQIDELRWQTETPAADGGANARRRPGEAPQAVSIKPVRTISAEVSGQIVPFDGNMRNAFSIIGHLEDSLRQRTAFEQVSTTEFPLDASSTSSVSGELVNKGGQQFAHFRMRLSLNVANPEDDGETG